VAVSLNSPSNSFSIAASQKVADLRLRLVQESEIFGSRIDANEIIGYAAQKSDA
jgi:hypothetical protein